METIKKTGILFDGYHTWLGFKDILGESKLHLLNFTKAESNLRAFIKAEINWDSQIMYRGWFQGIRKGYLPYNDVKKLRGEEKEGLMRIINKYHRDRELHWALIEAGIEPLWLQLKKLHDANDVEEKGVDAALVIAALRRVDFYNLDTLIVFTNDRDYEPLFHNLRKHNISVITVDCTPEGSRNYVKPFRYVDRSFYYREIFPDEKHIK